MPPTEHEMMVSHLRDGLGMVCQHIARTDEPVIITRYRKGIAAIVPLWEWRFFKELEADIRAGRKQIIDLEESLEFGPELAGTLADQPVSDCPDAGRRSPRDTSEPEPENDDGDQYQEGHDEEDGLEEAGDAEARQGPARLG